MVKQQGFTAQSLEEVGAMDIQIRLEYEKGVPRLEKVDRPLVTGVEEHSSLKPTKNGLAL
jgi:hypothetical protein